MVLAKPLEVEDAVFTIGPRRVLNGISFALKKGEFALLLGPNGAGKSSLIRAITGDTKLQSGSIRKARIAVLAQDPRQSTFDDLTVRENCRLITSKDCTEHLRQFHPPLAEMMDKPVRLLSGGERQALALALCLLNPPELLLLDEHTSALDPKTAERIMDLTAEAIKKYNMTTLMTTHNLDHASKYGNRILGLKDGEIAVDAPSMEREELLHCCYD